jgi:hypothetical protein
MHYLYVAPTHDLIDWIFDCRMEDGTVVKIYGAEFIGLCGDLAFLSG